MKRLLGRSALLIASAGLAVLPLSTAAFAEQMGVYISDSVYFSLDQVTLSGNTDSASLRFALQLNNGSGSAVDFNRYGVKVVDPSGVAYKAKLTEKAGARVKAHQAQSYKFSADVPAGVDASKLTVDVFEWSTSASGYMKEVGALSVGAAMESSGGAEQTAVLNMKDIDTTLTDDTLISAELGNSYRVYKDGVWMVYTDLTLENLGTISYKLPDALEYHLQAPGGLLYGAIVTGSGVPTLLPGARQQVTLQASVPASLSTDGLALVFSPKGQAKTTTLASLGIGGSFAKAKVGEAAAYPREDAQGLTVAASWASANKLSDGLHVQANVTLSNSGSDIVALPALSAEFQALRGALAVGASDGSAHPAYLAPGESATYRFSGIVPAGVSTDALQLVVLESAAAQAADAGAGAAAGKGSALPVLVAGLAGVGSNAEATAYDAAKPYTLGSPLPLSGSNAVDSNLEVALEDLHMHKNDDYGYNTVIAKYKVTNKGTTAIDVPNLATELSSGSGYTYAGTRQALAVKQLLPNTSYVVSYSYMMSSSDTGEKLALGVYDADHLSLGAFQVALQQEPENGPFSFYPFDVTFNDYAASWTYNSGGFIYRLRLNLSLERKDAVIVDSAFSKMTFDLVDPFGEVLSTTSVPFSGSGKLIDGEQIVTFSSIKGDQVQSGLSVRVYEEITTADGPVKRLIKTMPL
uniref:Uncharacterized protein n=2 Tax=Paenibacillus athensensis TaxID=1967502 RepID=A0A4Y8Q769_9BACL